MIKNLKDLYYSFTLKDWIGIVVIVIFSIFYLIVCDRIRHKFEKEKKEGKNENFDEDFDS